MNQPPILFVVTSRGIRQRAREDTDATPEESLLPRRAGRTAPSTGRANATSWPQTQRQRVAAVLLRRCHAVREIRDSGRARGQAPPQQDLWPLGDPEDSWPLAPRPPAEPAGYWSPGDPEDSWAAPALAQGGLRDDGGPEAGPEESWAAPGPAEGEPPASWDQGGGPEFWSPDSRPHGAPRDPWRPPPTREDLRGEDLRGPVRGPVRGAEPPPRRASGRGDHSAPGPTRRGDHSAPGPTRRGDLPPDGDHFFPAPAPFTGRLQEGARPPEDFRPPEDHRPPDTPARRKTIVPPDKLPPAGRPSSAGTAPARRKTIVRRTAPARRKTTSPGKTNSAGNTNLPARSGSRRPRQARRRTRKATRLPPRWASRIYGNRGSRRTTP